MNLALDVIIILSNFLSLDVILKLSKCLIDDIPLTVRKEGAEDLSVQSVVHSDRSMWGISKYPQPFLLHQSSKLQCIVNHLSVELHPLHSPHYHK